MIRELALIVCCATAAELVRVDLIVQRSVWEKAAAHVCAPVDREFYPGCGARVVSSGSSGNGNESMWYFTIETTQAQLDGCVMPTIEKARAEVR